MSLGLALLPSSPRDLARAAGLYPAANLGPGVFLYAVPELPDPNFFHTVILLITYNADGAMGLIINRPTRHHTAEVIPDLDMDKEKSPVLYFGGPVERERVLLIFEAKSPPEDSLKILDRIFLSQSRELLDEMIKGEGATANLRVYAGYAGWGPGQLDRETARGDWVVGRARAEAIFAENPESVWPEIFDIRKEIEVKMNPVPKDPQTPIDPEG